MDALIAILAILVIIAILYEIARRIGVPYPTLFVIGGLALGFLPGLPRIALEPDLVLLVFLPPLLFGAAFTTPLRDLRANLGPVVRLSVGLVVFTMIIVATVAQAAIPGLGWPAAFALGAIVAPTDALAATTVFRRLGAPRLVVTLIEGEALFNDATALVAYRAAVAAVAGGFVLSQAIGGFALAVVGGIVIGLLVGRVAAEILRRLDDPPVEVAISLVIPFAAYLPAERLGLSGVLAAVTAGLVIGRRLGTILSPSSRVLWLSTWKMVGFVLNGFVFVLIGLELPADPSGPRRPIAHAAARPHHAHLCGGRRDPVPVGLRLEPASRVAAPGHREARPATGEPAHVRRQLGGAARRRVAGRRTRPAGDVSGAEPDPAGDLRGHPGDARRPGTDAARSSCGGPAGMASSPTATR